MINSRINISAEATSLPGPGRKRRATFQPDTYALAYSLSGAPWQRQARVEARSALRRNAESEMEEECVERDKKREDNTTPDERVKKKHSDSENRERLLHEKHLKAKEQQMLLNFVSASICSYMS